MLRRFTKICILLIIFFAFFEAKSFASSDVVGEKISEMDVQINVNEDSTIDVEEKITVNITENIQELIVRKTIPVEFEGKKGRVKVVDVLENGKVVNYISSKKDRDVIIKVDKNFREVGLYTITLKYKLYDFIDFKKDENNFSFKLLGSSWTLPISSLKVKIVLPKKTQIFRESLNIKSVTNELEWENKNISNQVAGETIEIIYDHTIQPKEDVLVRFSVEPGTIKKPSLKYKFNNWLKENCISIVLMGISIFIFAFEIYDLKKNKKLEIGELDTEKRNEVKLKNKVKLLIISCGIIFTLIFSFLVAQKVNYYYTANYMINVFVKFLELMLLELIFAIILMYVITIEFRKSNIVSKMLSSSVILSVFLIGVLYLSNFIEDIYYNLFGYIVLLFIFISNFIYAYKLNKKV